MIYVASVNGELYMTSPYFTTWNDHFSETNLPSLSPDGGIRNLGTWKRWCFWNMGLSGFQFWTLLSSGVLICFALWHGVCSLPQHSNHSNPVENSFGVNRCLEKPMTSFWVPLVPLLVAQMGFLKSEYIRFSSMGPWMDFPWNNQRQRATMTMEPPNVNPLSMRGFNLYNVFDSRNLAISMWAVAERHLCWFMIILFYMYGFASSNYEVIWNHIYVY